MSDGAATFSRSLAASLAGQAAPSPADIVVVDELPRTPSPKVSLRDVAALCERRPGDVPARHRR